VAGGRVFVLGVGGVLSCLDAGTGRLLWRKDSEGYPGHGACASPLVADGLCIVPVGTRGKGGLTAYDEKSGEVRWRSKRQESWESPAYGSPVLVDLAGERQVVTFTAGITASLVGVSAATGQRLWGLRATLDGCGACLTPVRYKDLLLFADYGKPPWAIRLEKGTRGLEARDAWKAKGPGLCSYCSPVLAGDWLLGFSDQRTGHLFCLDAQTGQTLWQSEGRLGPLGASILNAGSVWLVLTYGGRLLVVKPSGTAYEPIAKYRVSEEQTWAHPVFLGDRILIKDETTLRLFRIDPDAEKP
jgi:outer membrane protein assembly factor BamB